MGIQIPVKAGELSPTILVSLVGTFGLLRIMHPVASKLAARATDPHLVRYAASRAMVFRCRQLHPHYARNRYEAINVVPFAVIWFF